MSQTQTPIIPIIKSEIRDYSDRIVPNIWIERQVPNVGDEINDLSQLIKFITEADQTICLMIHKNCQNLLNHELRTILSQRIEKDKIRTYIVCDDINLFQSEDFNQLLVREVSSLPEGIMILTDAHAKSAGFLASKSLGFTLSKEQIQTLFIFFCECFWKDAKKEKIVGKVKEISQNNDISQKLLVKPKDDSILMMKLPHGECEFRKAFFCYPIPSELRILEELLSIPSNDVKNHNCNIIRSDKKFKDIPFALILGKVTSYFLVKYGKEWFILSLVPEQVNIAEKWFNNQFAEASFDWSKEITRVELKDKNFYYHDNLDSKLEVKNQTKKDLGELRINLNDEAIESQNSLDSMCPKEDLFKDDGRSLTIEYSWKLIPPKLPENVQKDPLYKEWEKISEADKPIDADSENNIQALPEIGILFIKSGKRYLQIQCWEELAKAKQEVKRFTNAEIVI